MRNNIPDHEKIFDEICGKLSELSQKQDEGGANPWDEQKSRVQSHIKKSQDELKSTQMALNEKISQLEISDSFDDEAHADLKRVTEQLENERNNSSKLSGDLAKSLELNLKLQFEIEEIKSKSNQTIIEERKHNQYLTEKNRAIANELELQQALNGEVKSEIVKAKEKLQELEAKFDSERQDLLSVIEAKDQKLTENEKTFQNHAQKFIEFEEILAKKQKENEHMSETIAEFENHSTEQTGALRNLSAVAEKKIVELKMALDRKHVESQDYYSHLQQALTSMAILKQENSALKDYINKMGQLQGKSSQATAPSATHQSAQL
jgi:hypothetical protein